MIKKTNYKPKIEVFKTLKKSLTTYEISGRRQKV